MSFLLVGHGRGKGIGKAGFAMKVIAEAKKKGERVGPGVTGRGPLVEIPSSTALLPHMDPIL